MSAAAADRAPVEHFERLARGSEDPWGTATSAYEQAKFRRTLAHLPARIGAGLDLGCSVGVLTALLAPRCERLLAVDFSPTALARAAERLAGCDNVELRQADLPAQTPAGPFDAIVCSEVLYYWSPQRVREGLARIEAALAPGGTFLAVHWRHRDPRRALDGDAVHALLRAETGLVRCGWEASPDYLLDAWLREEEPAGEAGGG